MSEPLTEAWRDHERAEHGTIGLTRCDSDCAPDVAARLATALSHGAAHEVAEPAEADPIETFVHPYRAPVVIDGHQFRHTSDCEWPMAHEERGLDAEWFVREVIAYYKLYDHSEVWNERGARSLGKWLAVRLATPAPTTEEPER